VPTDEEKEGDDIRLGGVVVSKCANTFGGVVWYDLGKETNSVFRRTSTLNESPIVLRSAIQQLVAQQEMEDRRIGSGAGFPRRL
jgi:hypothetical protein